MNVIYWWYTKTISSFLSQSDTLVTVTFVSNENDLYSVSGWTEESDLDHPSEFLMNGHPDQFILFPYQKHNNIVFGWCYTAAQFTVNGISPMRKTFSFDVKGKTYSIDFWTVNGHILDDDISIEYFPNWLTIIILLRTSFWGAEFFMSKMEKEISFRLLILGLCWWMNFLQKDTICR